MWMTSIGATSIILFVYLVVSRRSGGVASLVVSGYLLFGEDTKGNILLNFSHDSIPPTVARIGLGLGIICHFPITYFAVRTNLHSIFCSARQFHSLGLRFMWVCLGGVMGRTAIGVLLSTVTVAILQTKVEVVIGLNGSLFGSLIMFAIPGLMYIVYALVKHCYYRAAKGDKGTLRKKIEAWFMIIFGVTMCIVGTTMNVLKIVNGEEQ